MEFCHFLTSYMPDPNIGSEKHFQNMIDQSILAEKLGYKTVSIPEHHLINIILENKHKRIVFNLYMNITIFFGE